VTDAFGNPAPTTARVKRGPGRPIKRKTDARGDGDHAYNRRGEIVTRNRVSGNGYVNEFDIPESVRQPGWDLYWARASVHGKPDQSNLNALYDNGWEPASPKNYASVMPDMRGKPTIERDGMILMERPMKLTHQALAEGLDDALELRETSAETFGSRKLPDGFDKGRKSRKGNFDASKRIVRGEYVQSPKEAKPAYEYADGDE
jgi:hypothetical protein